MQSITVTTRIAAPRELCFDLARDIQVHEVTAAATGERVIDVSRTVANAYGTLLCLGDEVTFDARHLGVRQRLTSKIVEYDRPRSFVDEMQRGAFKRLRHTHRFDTHQDGSTVMIDEVDFASPFGPLGWIVDRVFLAAYLKRFLAMRGQELKRFAELRISDPKRRS